VLDNTFLSIWEAADIRDSLEINTTLLLAPYNDKRLTFQDSQFQSSLTYPAMGMGPLLLECHGAIDNLTMSPRFV